MVGTHQDIRNECANDPEFFIFGLFDGSTSFKKISLTTIISILITMILIIGILVWCYRKMKKVGEKAIKEKDRFELVEVN